MKNPFTVAAITLIVVMSNSYYGTDAVAAPIAQTSKTQATKDATPEGVQSQGSDTKVSPSASQKSNKMNEGVQSQGSDTKVSPSASQNSNNMNEGVKPQGSDTKVTPNLQ
jgi:hypothetical protein